MSNKPAGGFYPLRVAQVIQETAQSATLVLIIPEQWQADFPFVPGQFITFRLQHQEQEYRRSYSVSGKQGDKLMITIKRVADGTISNYLLDEARPGFKLEATIPAGLFTLPTEVDPSTQHVFFAAGSGITPIMAMIDSLLDDNSTSAVALLYANHSEQDTIFKERLASLQAHHPDRFILTHYWSDKEHGQRLNRISIADWFDDLRSGEKRAYVCGPTGFMKEAIAVAEGRLPAEHLRTEKFVAGASGLPLENEGEPQLKAKLRVTVDGETKEIALNERDVLLTKAAQAGLEPPHNCMSGICGVCMARLEKGEVVMDEDYALTDEDRAKGFILTCQTRAASEEVVIRYF